MSDHIGIVPDIAPLEIRHDLLFRREIALIDLREEAQFATGHPLFAANLPLSRIELDVLDRVPRRSVKVVLYDGGGGLVERAFRILVSLGYANVHRLAGDIQAWAAMGYELFRDVNSYSKAFGELVEHERRTPSLSAAEVKRLQDAGEDVVILDARRFDEYATMNIPGSISVPGAELVLRAAALTRDAKTRVIVNCAGRTRSLIGAQSLINAGIPNPVAALRNGTIGWSLAGQALEHGQGRQYPPASADYLDEARGKAREVAYRAGVKSIDLNEMRALSGEQERTCYWFDVRPLDEYLAGHIAGFRHAPGGQLVQEIDVFAPVRGARIVLADNWGVRADMTASWLAQLGWEVYVLDSFASAQLEMGSWVGNAPPLPEVAEVTPAELARRLGQGDTLVLDLGPSRQYQDGHIPGAVLVLRSQMFDLIDRVYANKSIVLLSRDGALAHFAAAEITACRARHVEVLAGGTAGWVDDGRPVETGLSPGGGIVEDVYKRPYEGNDNAPEAMQAYLDWEYGLVEQLARDGTHGFSVI